MIIMKLKHALTILCWIVVGISALSIEQALNSLQRSKRVSKDDFNGGIIIDVNSDYPSENYYYDNYDFTEDIANLNNTFKVESSIDGEVAKEEIPLKPVVQTDYRNQKPKPPSSPFALNDLESDLGFLAAEDDNEREGNYIKIDSPPVSPPRFKPAYQQVPASQSDKTDLNSNNNLLTFKQQPQQQKQSKSSTNFNMSQRSSVDLKLIGVSVLAALVGTILLLSVTIFACVRYRNRSQGLRAASKPVKKTTNSKQYVAVDQS